MKKKNILFLYTSLAEYFMSGCRALAKDANVNVIHWAEKGSAPYQFELTKGIELHKREPLDFESMSVLVSNFSPDVIVCSGWVDKLYLKLCKKYFNKIPTVVIVDNHWTNSPKQILASAISPFFLLNKFSHVWIPGSPQLKYANKLGFRDQMILKGYYSANVDFFESFYNPDIIKPKRFLYLGRYVKLKGVFDLWDAFRNYRSNGGSWELWCVGTGEEWENRPKMDGLKHFGFLQQNEMNEILSDCSVYILPSHFEPWAVSVHEMASAGMPLLLSKEVGAASKFLVEGENGYSFEACQSDEIESLMHRMEKKSETEIKEMGGSSHQLALKLTPEHWAKTILNL